MAYYSQKLILAKTQYKTHNGELLAIVETLKIWRHYLKGCKHKLLVLTNYNNFYRFIETKNPSFCQVRWIQKFSQYHFWIDYCQGKANGAADALSLFLQKNEDEEEKLWAESIRILYCLQSPPTNATLLGLSALVSLLSLYHVLICGTHALPQLRQF